MMAASLLPALLLAAPVQHDDSKKVVMMNSDTANTCAACQILSLDFGKVSGPSVDKLYKDDGELRWNGVGMFEGEAIDVVMTKTLNAKNTCYSGNGMACHSEPAKYYGGINVGRGPLDTLSGTITLRYSSSNKKAVVPMFCMTWVDLDGSEFVTIAGVGNKFVGYAAGDALIVEDTMLEYPYPADLRAAKKFSRVGEKANIENTHTTTPPMDMSVEQRQVGFEVYFTHTAEFEFVFGDLRTGNHARTVWFTGTSNYYDNCPKLVPAPPPSAAPSNDMTCTVVADPIITTFNGWTCAIKEVGTYPVLKKGDFQIQSFHCPNNVHLGTANVVAMAVSDGDGDVLEVVGDTVTLNGNVISEELPYTEIGSFTIERDGDAVIVKGGRFLTLRSGRRFNDKLPTTYDQKLSVTVPRYLAEKMPDGCMCGAVKGSEGVKPLTKEESLFSEASISTVQGLCGVSTTMELFAAAERVRTQSWKEDATRQITGSVHKEGNLPNC
jgi:hypothetical protein